MIGDREIINEGIREKKGGKKKKKTFPKEVSLLKALEGDGGSRRANFLQPPGEGTLQCAASVVERVSFAWYRGSPR